MITVVTFDTSITFDISIFTLKCLERYLCIAIVLRELLLVTESIQLFPLLQLTTCRVCCLAESE